MSRVKTFSARAFGVLLLAGVSASLGGCNTFGLGGGGDEYVDVKEDPADQLYNEGLVLLNEGAYGDAVKKFEELDRTHPYSDWARKSLLMSAYANFQAEKYSDTITAAKRYVTLYPGSEDAAYAQYLVGESYYRQISDVGRDQGRSEKATTAFRELLEKYPNSEYAAQARDKLDVSRDQLAGKEMEVGRYYLGKHQYLAAINRFKTVVTEYQTTRHVEEALERLTEAYYALGIISEAQTAAAILGYNYPDSQWYKDAYALLKEGGYEPRENKSSWISRAWTRTKAAL